MKFSVTQDLALVKLNVPGKMIPHVKVVFLPHHNKELKTAESCFAVGLDMTRGNIKFLFLKF